MHKSKHSDCFRNSIQSFVKYAETKESTEFVISQICSDFGFQKRRLYDVINVLEPVGVCKKTSVDTIQWNGVSKVPHFLMRLQKKYHLNSADLSLEDLFMGGDEKCISIAHLTVSFVLLFFALNQRSLDIKQIGVFLSKNNGRYKTTLCKLYQIAHILEAATIFQKSISPGEMTLGESFFVPVEIDKCEEVNPLSIESLLNKPSPTNNTLMRRRMEFFSEFEKVSIKMFSMPSQWSNYQVYA
ncbi:hypothetical protein TRFO_11791 [Tritrichomonas foetus]|uniref:E2F/DP family winged-helix DNA-binding domain-containing protein n=1 Tax=Tritrichomonas foetus TaxID=1144522 RepID=A0A1J4J1B6_9EUKA|nr:hypothetical protein TRFO_11791 [Tritrichomonas foetus]|eukprot:OHS93390.1 hypothetical protein TRFO_11791 [Tritrichomonas foetus]